MTTNDAPVRFLSTREASRYLGLSPSTLSTWRSRGGGPSFRKFGKHVAYSIEDLDQWADAHQTLRSTSEA